MALNYQAIINAFQLQINTMIKDDERFYDLNVFVVNEQAFEKKKLKPNEMMVVVRFGSASVLEKKLDIPVYFDIIGLSNEIEQTQLFFSEFALRFNAVESSGVLQYWNTPSVMNRFNNYGYETRATFSMQGALVISLSEGIVNIQVYNEDTEEYENIRFLNADLTSDFAPLPEATGDSNGENRTTNQTRTVTFSFSTYVIDSFLVNNAIEVAFGGLSFNKKIMLKIEINNLVVEKEFVFSKVDVKQETGANSVMSIVMVV